MLAIAAVGNATTSNAKPIPWRRRGRGGGLGSQFSYYLGPHTMALATRLKGQGSIDVREGRIWLKAAIFFDPIRMDQPPQSPAGIPWISKPETRTAIC